MSKPILIVEDQKGFRKVYSDILSSQGYEPLTAEDGEKGWAMARDQKPLLILLDLGLPLLDGIGVLERLKADETTRAIPVIIFSVTGEGKEIQRALELGANDYVVKGMCPPSELLKKIETLLHGV
jgi:DNA-binding response OmpR family regulator